MSARTKKGVITLQYSDGGADAPPEDGAAWNEDLAYFVGTGDDKVYIHTIVNRMRDRVQGHPGHWWRIIYTETTTLRTTAGKRKKASKPVVIAGPDCRGKHETEFTMVDGQYRLNVNLALADDDVKVEGQTEVAAPDPYSKPGEDPPTEDEGSQTVILDEDGNQVTATLNLEGESPLPSGTEVIAVDERGVQYTVTVL